VGRWERPADWPHSAVCLLHVDGHAIFVSVHAARRWAQRVRRDPRRQLKEVCPDIERIARACGEVKSFAPLWSNPALQEDEDAELAGAEMWLMFGPDIAMPVRSGIAVTTLDRGSLGPEARAFRPAPARGVCAAGEGAGAGCPRPQARRQVARRASQTCG
jgi:hypothetical protein